MIVTHKKLDYIMFLLLDSILENWNILYFTSVNWFLERQGNTHVLGFETLQDKCNLQVPQSS